MKKTKGIKTKASVTFCLSTKQIEVLELYSEQIGISRSSLVGLALNEYLYSKADFRANPKIRELIPEELEIYEASLKDN